MMKIRVILIAATLCFVVGNRAHAIGLSGLILPTRYYDAAEGRFISPDTVSQDPYDPQSRNRYSYVRNNPMNNVDPSGNSWLSKSIGSDFKKIVPFVNPYIAPNWTIQSVKDNREAYIAAGIGFVTSGGNPVVAAAAFATEMGMQTGEGRQTTNHVSKEVFVDVFGMNPQTANTFANITLRMAAMAGIEGAWAHYGPNQLRAVRMANPENPEDIQGGSAQAGEWFGPPASGGGGEGERYYALNNMNGNQVGTAMDRPLQDFRILGRLGVDHTGVNMIGYNGGTVPSPLYGSWGVCHTATNRTLFQAGYSSTVSSLGVGGWSTTASSLIYGNYGGGLYRAAYWGYETGN